MARITGIGGVFIKSRRDAKALADWYRTNLGLTLQDFGGAVLNWTEDRAEDNGLTVWHVAEKESDWFSPSTAEFMINYRVDDMDGMIKQLKDSGIDLFQGPESHENGIFAWVLDPEGNKVELWEPKIWDEKNKA